MVEKVVAAISSFRQAARDANDNVRQLLGGLMPSASRANESATELNNTAKASAQSDNDTSNATSKAAAVAGETASLGQEILSQLRAFSKKFSSLISGEGGGGSLVDSILGLGAGVGGLAAMSGAFEDISYNPGETSEGTSSGEGPQIEGFSGNLSAVTTADGKHRAFVAAEYAENFQGFLNDLEATGYKIYSLEGYNHRPVRGSDGVWMSYHGLGAAIDINPGTNPWQSTKTDMPPETEALAKKWGLGWGISFKDPMHFSIAKFEGGSVNIERQKYTSNAPKTTIVNPGTTPQNNTNTDNQVIDASLEGSDEHIENNSTSAEQPSVTTAAKLTETENLNNGANLSIETASYVRPEIIQSPENITQSNTTSSFAEAETPNIPLLDPRLTDIKPETVSFRPENTTLAAAKIDLAPAPNYSNASSSGTGARTPAVKTTQAAMNPAPKNNTEVATIGSRTPSGRITEIVFDPSWRNYANGDTVEEEQQGVLV